MNILVVKVISGCLFFFLSLLFGWLPFYLYQRILSPGASGNLSQKSVEGETKVTRVVSHLHSFASGVLVAICLLHLLPGSQEVIRKEMRYTYDTKNIGPNQISGRKEFQTDHVNQSFLNRTVMNMKGVAETSEEAIGTYPVAELVIAMGFIFVYILDRTFKVISKSSKHGSSKAGNGSIRYEKLQMDFSSDTDEEFYYGNVLEETKNLTENVKEIARFDNAGASSCQGKGKKLECDKCPSRSDLRIKQSTAVVASESHHLNSSDDMGDDSVDVRSVALVLALCVHGFFDGVMLGLQTSSTVILPLLFALSIHKIFVSVSLSLTLAKNFTLMVTARRNIPISKSGKTRPSPIKYFLYLLSFASVAPLGLFASAAILHTGWSGASKSVPNGDVTMAAGLVQSFAVGTFLYVAFTEMSDRHGASKSKSSLKSEILHHLLLLLGFSLMAGLRAAFGDT